MIDTTAKFVRKGDYDENLLKKCKKLISLAGKIHGEKKYDILAVPNEKCIRFYFEGFPFAETRIRGKKLVFILHKSMDKDKKESYAKYFAEEDKKKVWDLAKSDFEGCIFDPHNGINNLKIILEGTACAQPNDKERHTQHYIALNHLTYNEDSYSLCGYETTISPSFFKEKPKQAGIDFVLICPKDKRLILVEFKCQKKTLEGSSGVLDHLRDYNIIVYEKDNIKLVQELVKAYNLMKYIYTDDNNLLNANDIKSVDIAFLLTGTTSNDTLENLDKNITIEDNSTSRKKVEIENEDSIYKKTRDLYWCWYSDYNKVIISKDTLDLVN